MYTVFDAFNDFVTNNIKDFKGNLSDIWDKWCDEKLNEENWFKRIVWWTNVTKLDIQLFKAWFNHFRKELELH